MQEPTTRKPFRFHGHAIAAAGKITSPFQDIIPSQASSALSISGGYDSARVENFRYKEIFSFASAYTEVVGAYVDYGRDGRAYETLSLSAIEKVNFLDVDTCDRIVARITVKYPEDGRTPPTVVTAGSRFERLRVGDVFYEKLDLAPDLFAKYGAPAKSDTGAGGGDSTSERGEEYLPDVLYEPRPIRIQQVGELVLGQPF